MSAFSPHFGTDGIRGAANTELTPELALRLGLAAGSVLAGGTGERTVLVGRDTRISGDMLTAALSAGLASAGCTVLNVGILPTPAISRLVVSESASAGAVISASHNPFPDNGIKFFGADGKKLTDLQEEQIEAAMDSAAGIHRVSGGDIGRTVDANHLKSDYFGILASALDEDLDGLSLVLDCANGATSVIAPTLFAYHKAEVHPMFVEPNGVNINLDCGSTHPQAMSIYVKATEAHAGLAFDGDGDRVMMCDEMGSIVDGDRMLLVCAVAMKRRGELTNAVVVATVMSNVGLELALDAHGIRLVRANVGDRYVAEAMEREGAAIGGEQSGHLLFPRLSPTGDGMLTGLQVLAEMKSTGKRLSELTSEVVSYPQLLRNVKVKDRASWEHSAQIQEAIVHARGRFGKPEWLSVRASGTEPLVRVMAQDTSAELVETTVESLCGLIREECGA